MFCKSGLQTNSNTRWKFVIDFFFPFLFKFLIEKKKKPKKFKMIDSLVHASALYVFIELSGFPRNSDIFKTLFPRFRPFHFREHVLTWKKIV
jgi:hypothetical protein